MRAMCGWLDVLRSFLLFLSHSSSSSSSSSVSLSLSLSLYSMDAGDVIFARFARFVLLLFLSLVVRTAELDGGCMRLSRDHMWVLSSP